MPIMARFDQLDLLSPEELRGAMRAFAEARDRLAGEGREALADIYATVLAALAEERDRRRCQWQRVQGALLGAEGPAEWEDPEGGMPGER